MRYRMTPVFTELKMLPFLYDIVLLSDTRWESIKTVKYII